MGPTSLDEMQLWIQNQPKEAIDSVGLFCPKYNTASMNAIHLVQFDPLGGPDS